jgi:hypothetical protein
VQRRAGWVTRTGVAAWRRSRADEPKVRSKQPYARAVLPLLVERSEKRTEQALVAFLPVLQQIGEIVDSVHQVCQAVTILGSKSATMTTVGNEARVNRCVLQYFETRR